MLVWPIFIMHKNRKWPRNTRWLIKRCVIVAKVILCIRSHQVSFTAHQKIDWDKCKVSTCLPMFKKSKLLLQLNSVDKTRYYVHDVQLQQQQQQELHHPYQQQHHRLFPLHLPYHPCQQQRLLLLHLNHHQDLAKIPTLIVSILWTTFHHRHPHSAHHDIDMMVDVLIAALMKIDILQHLLQQDATRHAAIRLLDVIHHHPYHPFHEANNTIPTLILSLAMVVTTPHHNHRLCRNMNWTTCTIPWSTWPYLHNPPHPHHHPWPVTRSKSRCITQTLGCCWCQLISHLTSCWHASVPNSMRLPLYASNTRTKMTKWLSWLMMMI